MLKILFSPSEGKKAGGSLQKGELFGALNARDEILNSYNEIVTSGDEEQILQLFGIKKIKDAQPYMENIFTAPHMPAIERYSGVAYDYLAYEQLTESEQTYLQKNTLIFSNLYGPILGGDPIPMYKVKQGNKIGTIAPEKFYKERFSYQLDLFLQQEEILDLRAGYYDKFYKTTQPYTTLKFLKDGKSVSHWAKAYRGSVLRALAENNISSLDEFRAMEIEGLQVKEIQVIKNKTEIVFDIINNK